MNENPISMLEENKRVIFCPICKRYFQASEYLFQTFEKDPGTEWLANMITHYRHQHRAYDRNIRYVENHFNISHEIQKQTINEQAKRQIARKCKDYMIQNNIGLGNLMELQKSDEKTYTLYKKLFGHFYVPKPKSEKPKTECPLNCPTELMAFACPNCSYDNCEVRKSPKIS
jgi:hypothetical protein